MQHYDDKHTFFFNQSFILLGIFPQYKTRTFLKNAAHNSNCLVYLYHVVYLTHVVYLWFIIDIKVYVISFHHVYNTYIMYAESFCIITFLCWFLDA